MALASRTVSVAAMLTMCAGAAIAADPALTIYNGNFAVVRETVPLQLNRGVNRIDFADATAHVEPDSVILRDPTGRRKLQILEQNYRNDPVTQQLLLAHFEGQEIDFEVFRDGKPEIVKGRIVRSGFIPHYEAWGRFGNSFVQTQNALVNNGGATPIIEVGGQLRFGLPGTPLFPALADDSILKPTFEWEIETNVPGAFDAELAYVTGGMTWEADYNIVAPETGSELAINGWITMENQTGKTFEDAHIKLLAGDVNKLQPQQQPQMRYSMRDMAESAMTQNVTEKSFDEYHLYSVARPVTLRDRETKQVEFVGAEGVASQQLYVYDGAWIDPNQYGYWNWDQIRREPSYGTQSNPKIWVMRQFENTEENGLGIALPKGRVRFYRQDTDGRLEFVGENMIDHTPKDETVRVYTGNAFDIVGSRTQTNFKVDWDHDWLRESFEISLRNHKDEAVDVVIVEHLYRWTNWEVQKASDGWTKTDARTVEFRVHLAPDEEKKVTYDAYYTW